MMHPDKKLFKKQIAEGAVALVVLPFVFYKPIIQIEILPLQLGAAAQYLWLSGYLIFCIWICLSAVSGKSPPLEIRPAPKKGRFHWRFADRLEVSGGRGFVGFLAAFYGESGQKKARAVFIAYFIALFLWLFVIPSPARLDLFF